MLVMAFALLLAACNSRQKAPADEVEKEEAVVDSQSVGNCYDQLVIAEALVEVDPDFSSTDDYTKARENYDSIMGIYLKDLDERGCHKKTRGGEEGHKHPRTIFRHSYRRDAKTRKPKAHGYIRQDAERDTDDYRDIEAHRQPKGPGGLDK